LIVAVSRFRVANGIEHEVRDAFMARAGLVDGYPGFQGIEVLADARDTALFVLLTRWQDEESFHSWHRSEAHRRSHKGIPRGLKLDPSFTEFRVMESVPLDGPGESEAVEAARGFLARYLLESETIHLVVAHVDGRVLWCNAGMAAGLGFEAASATGQPLSRWLVDSDASRLRALVLGGPSAAPQRLLLNFLHGAEQAPYTLTCTVQVGQSGFVLAGEPVVRDERSLREELVHLNNELSTALREKERARRALEAAKEELERNYWHLKKIQEVLPICMYCGKVKTGEAHWEDVVEYLKRNSLFLSHGLCPDCGRKFENVS
jgi:heme-degrading monooxygenase HmoA